MYLDKKEERMLAGEHDPAAELTMKAVVKVGDAVRAESVVPNARAPEIDTTFTELGEPGQARLTKSLIESIANNSAIASWIMLFSGYYMAHKLASQVHVRIKTRALGCLEINLLLGLSYVRKKLWVLDKCFVH